MTKEEAIKYLQQLYPNGGHCWLDEQRIEAIGMAVKALQEEPVSDDLIVATNNYCVNVRKGYPRVMDETDRYICNAFKDGAKWQAEQMMANAVDGAFIRRNRYTKKNVLNGLDMTCDAIQGFKDKDKIKVLFIKND